MAFCWDTSHLLLHVPLSIHVRVCWVEKWYFMHSVTFLLKAKKLLWFIYDLLTLSKTKIFNVLASLEMRNKGPFCKLVFFCPHNPPKLWEGYWSINGLLMCLLSFKENDASMQIATISLEFWHYEQCVLKKNDTTFSYRKCKISVLLNLSVSKISAL